MNERQSKPDLVEMACPRCQRNAWAERGAQMLCQSCVNEFLARNVGLMEEVDDRLGPDQVVPLTDPREGTIERAALKDGFIPGQEGPHGGGTG